MKRKQNVIDFQKELEIQEISQNLRLMSWEALFVVSAILKEFCEDFEVSPSCNQKPLDHPVIH